MGERAERGAVVLVPGSGGPRRVLYIRTDGELVDAIEAIVQRLRARTREPVSASSIARRLLWAALDSPKAQREAGLA